MKSSYIWGSVILMTIVFIGLVIIQSIYFNKTFKFIGEQFDEIITKSLYRTVVNLQEDEIKTYMDEFIRESQDRLDNNDKNSNNNPCTNYGTKETLFPGASGTLRISSEKDYNRRIEESTLLLNKMMMWHANEAPYKNIFERVDVINLQKTLDRELLSSAIDLKYCFYITDESGAEVYIYNKFLKNKSGDVYTQRFFPSETGSGKSYYLNVTFPHKSKYIAKSLTYLIPLALLIVILWVTFITTIVYLLNQRKLDVMKNDFINNMTHELKTPISSISLAAQMLSDFSILNEKSVQRIAKIMKEETRRISFLIDRVLQMSVFEKEKAALKLEPHNIEQIIRHIADNFSIKVESLGGSIITHYCDPNLEVMIDEMHFTNVIYNLLDNAIKYKRDIPILIITLKKEKGRLNIEVEDNGIGIRKEDFKKLFDKFFRVSTGNLHDVKGFGLGLAYVKKIVTEHDGTIKVESELGVGTKFTISLKAIEV